jgi:hypothetical protein
MLTETLSGKCPYCGYDKLLQRYGSDGYYQMDGCPNCGFGYGSNHYDEQTFGVGAWLDYGIHILACVALPTEPLAFNEEAYNKRKAELERLEENEVRRLVFEWAESEDRVDDVENTVFVYTQSDIDKWAATNPVVFKGKLFNMNIPIMQININK